MLEAVGLSAADDAVYEVLLGAAHASLDTLVDATGRPEAEVRASLSRLVDHGLVQPDQFSRCSYLALSPHADRGPPPVFRPVSRSTPPPGWSQAGPR